MVAVYCVECRKSLKEYGEVAEIVYDHVCEWYCAENRAIEIDQEHMHGLQCRKPVIDFLEHKGLLVTTESGKNFIAIKPSSLNVIGEENLYFCSGRHVI
jgi:hypothetical protein